MQEPILNLEPSDVGKLICQVGRYRRVATAAVTYQFMKIGTIRPSITRNVLGMRKTAISAVDQCEFIELGTTRPPLTKSAERKGPRNGIQSHSHPVAVNLSTTKTGMKSRTISRSAFGTRRAAIFAGALCASTGVGTNRDPRVHAWFSTSLAQLDFSDTISTT